jgi:hypothetical protein
LLCLCLCLSLLVLGNQTQDFAHASQVLYPSKIPSDKI